MLVPDGLHLVDVISPFDENKEGTAIEPDGVLYPGFIALTPVLKAASAMEAHHPISLA